MSDPDRGYRVDLEHLDAVTARIAGLHGFIIDSLAGLDSRIAAAHQDWTGAAADKHAEARTANGRKRRPRPPPASPRCARPPTPRTPPTATPSPPTAARWESDP